MLISMKLLKIAKCILAQAKFTGVIITYKAQPIKLTKFKKAINKAIDLGYLKSCQNVGKGGDHCKGKHVDWLGQFMQFGYSIQKNEVPKQYVDHLVMLCAKVKTILDESKKQNVKLPQKNKKNNNMDINEYEQLLHITKEIAQKNVNIVLEELF